MKPTATASVAGSIPGRLAPAISGPQYFALAFGCIVGVAWIVVLGSLVARAGPGGTAIALSIGGVAVLLVALCYAEMAARRPAAGGELVYAFDLGGSGAAYATGWTLALIYTATCAFEAISIGQLVGLLFPALQGPELYRLLGHEVRLGGILIGLGCALGLWLLNVQGARGSAAAQQWTTYVRLGFMLIFLLVALAYADPANLDPPIPGATASAKFIAVLAVLGTAPFWYGGFNVVATATEEAATSMAVVGRALVFAILASGVFYIALVLAVSALVPPTQLAALELPAAQAFEIAMGTSVVAKLVLVTAILGNLTAWNALLMAGSRVYFALGRARLSPAALGRVNAGTGVPGVALALVSLISVLGLLLGKGFVLPLVNIASACFGVTYIVTCLALLKRRRDESDTVPAFRVPGGRPVILAALLAAIAITLVALVQPWLVSGGSIPVEWLTIAAWVVLSGVLWWNMRQAITAVPEAERAALLGGGRTPVPEWQGSCA